MATGLIEFSPVVVPGIALGSGTQMIVDHEAKATTDINLMQPRQLPGEGFPVSYSTHFEGFEHENSTASDRLGPDELRDADGVGLTKTVETKSFLLDDGRCPDLDDERW